MFYLIVIVCPLSDKEIDDIILILFYAAHYLTYTNRGMQFAYKLVLL